MTSSDRTARLVVVGSRGRLEVLNPLAPQLGHRLLIDAGGTVRTETVEGLSSYEAQLEAVRNTIVEGRPFPFAVDDFLRSMEAIEQVRHAISRLP